jgi:hypothetical protein
MSEPTEHLYPTRHGNWHVIDGKLVDVPLDEHDAADVTHTEQPLADASDTGGSPPHKPPQKRRYFPEG